MNIPRPLTSTEIASSAFRELLWFAVEVDDDALGLIIRDKLPALTIIGIVEPAVVAFAAYHRADALTTIEYIAVAASRRGKGFGARLVDAIKRDQPNTRIYAQTDDDAIGFYRACGFHTKPRARDPRWPQRQRYDCTLD